MKLYATITNEKGKTEGVGGSEYLDIDIKVGNKFVGRFTLRYSDELPVDINEDESGWALFDNTDGNDEPIHWIEDKPRYNSNKDALRCTARGCKELQTEDGEFCEKHFPTGTKQKDEKCWCESSELSIPHLKSDCKNPF